MFKNEQGYKPVTTNLAGYWGQNFADLPDDVQKLVKRVFPGDTWDKAFGNGVTAEEQLSSRIFSRQQRAAAYDYQHDPKHEPSTYFEIMKYIAELADAIEKAKENGKGDAEARLREVRDRLQQILDIDRERVGAEIQALRQAQPKGRWPWGSHETELLREMEVAAKRFWRTIDEGGNYDPRDQSTAPKNDAIEKFLTDRQVVKSQRMAQAIATILRKDGLKTGPR